ncbi:MAG: DUF177 domain-containing protein [Pseudomonadota bacterium]
MTPSDAADEGPFPVPVEVVTLPKSGFPVAAAASDEQLAAIAAEYGLQSVSRFNIRGTVFRWKSKGARFDGKLSAHVAANCVVTDVPVPQTIELPVDILFVPEGSRLTRPQTDGEDELVVDLESSDPPETFSGTSIDIGAVVLELFSLELDAFPRSPDAPEHVEFTTAGDEPETPVQDQASPFAALASLKVPKSDDGS